MTNETCWYETEGERSEDSYVDALGHHEVEAHWKYFTIDVADQAECNKASHLHYEFLINRCSPKHYLPVMAVFRPDEKTESLGTHFYPKMEVSEGKYSCWITFLGAHGHCEAHSSKYDLYNTDDTPEGYSKGSGSSAENCLSRADWWMKYCDTPVLATFVPGGVTSNWKEDWIMYDTEAAFHSCPQTRRHLWRRACQGKLRLETVDEAVMLSRIHRSKDDLWWTESCLRLRDSTRTKNDDYD